MFFLLILRVFRMEPSWRFIARWNPCPGPLKILNQKWKVFNCSWAEHHRTKYVKWDSDSNTIIKESTNKGFSIIWSFLKAWLPRLISLEAIPMLPLKIRKKRSWFIILLASWMETWLTVHCLLDTPKLLGASLGLGQRPSLNLTFGNAIFQETWMSSRLWTVNLVTTRKIRRTSREPWSLIRRTTLNLL